MREQTLTSLKYREKKIRISFYDVHDDLLNVQTYVFHIYLLCSHFYNYIAQIRGHMTPCSQCCTDSRSHSRNQTFPLDKLKIEKRKTN